MRFRLSIVSALILVALLCAAVFGRNYKAENSGSAGKYGRAVENVVPAIQEAVSDLPMVGARSRNGCGEWNSGQGPWREGEEWVYINEPHQHVVETNGPEMEAIQREHVLQRVASPAFRDGGPGSRTTRRWPPPRRAPRPIVPRREAAPTGWSRRRSAAGDRRSAATGRVPCSPCHSLRLPVSRRARRPWRTACQRRPARDPVRYRPATSSNGRRGGAARGRSPCAPPSRRSGR